jgi:hypothetical protein
MQWPVQSSPTLVLLMPMMNLISEWEQFGSCPQER